MEIYPCLGESCPELKVRLAEIDESYYSIGIKRTAIDGELERRKADIIGQCNDMETCPMDNRVSKKVGESQNA